MNKNAGFLFCFFFFAVGFIPGQQPWWYTLEQGKHYFRSGSYGNAMLAFQDASRYREERFTRMEHDFIRLLSIPEVRRIGDSLEIIEKYIAEHHRIEAAEALAELYHRVPKDSFEDSALKALDEFDKLKPYPEAEYWLGESYRVEGELGLALKQYQKAYDTRALLETSGFEIEILYKMAALHRLRQEYQEMESCLIKILMAADPSISAQRSIYWAGDNNSLPAAMTRILENDGISRFLSLYRNDNAQLEKAHKLLGLYYYASSRHTSAAEHLMFAFLIQNTLLINEARHIRFNYEFTNLDDLHRALIRRNDLKDWMEEVFYYRTAYYLASALYATGKLIPARQLWSFLASNNEAGEWQVKARNQLNSPYIEPAIELP